MIIRICVPESEHCKIMNECHASPYGGNFMEKEQHIRYSNQDFIGPMFSETVLNGSTYVIDARRLEISAEDWKIGNIIWKLVYTASSGLCFQIGRSNSLSKE